MIKLFGGRLKINLFIIPVTALMIWLAGMESFLAFFLALLLHEFAHSAFARALGVRVLDMELLPFGCAANMDGFALVSGGKEILIAAAGPAANLICAAGAFALEKAVNSSFLTVFMQSSLVLAAVNMMPVLPLDGGRMLMVMLGLILPRKSAVKIGCAMGIAVSAAICGFAVYAAVSGYFHPMLFMMGGFMLYSAIKSMRSDEFAFMKHVALKKSEIARRACVDVKHVAAPQSRVLGEVLTSLDPRKYNIVHILDGNYNVCRVVDEMELADRLIREGVDARLKK